MKVSELIEITNRLTTNHGNLTTKERATYLSFLNLANKDLYKVAATGLDSIAKTVKIFINNDNESFTLPVDFFTTRMLFINNIEILNGKLKNKYQTNDPKYFIQGNSIFLNATAKKGTFLYDTDPRDEANKKYIEFVYSPLPLTLVEEVVDPLLEIDEPIYPEPFHFYLIHGALFYFYLSNRVFIEKKSDIKELWEKDKQELAQYKEYGM